MIDWRDERDLALYELQTTKGEEGKEALEHLRRAGLHIANAIQVLEGTAP